MKQTKLFKKGCDPYVVTTHEELVYHLNQGWVENEADLEKEPVVIPLTKPYNVLTDTTAANDSLESAEIKSLKEALVAKDQVIEDMQADFEEVITGLNATIAQLRGDDFGLPAATTLTPGAPIELTNQQLRDKLDAVGIKHTPRDNKTTLLALVAGIKE